MSNDEQAIREVLQPDGRWVLVRDANLLMPEKK